MRTKVCVVAVPATRSNINDFLQIAPRLTKASFCTNSVASLQFPPFGRPVGGQNPSVMKRTTQILAFLACAAAAQAQSYIFTVSLSGAAENPANASPGSGSGTITLELNNPVDLDDNTLSYSISYSNLSANSTASHIHGPAATTANAPILLALTGQLGSTSGTLAANNVAASAAVTSALLNGLAYVNVHSTAIPSGEIRGQANQLAPVPEVDSAALVGGLLGVGAIAWRMRRR